MSRLLLPVELVKPQLGFPCYSLWDHSQVWLNFNIWAKFHNFGLNFTISTRNGGTQAAGVVSKSGIQALGWGIKIKYGPKGAKDEGLPRLLV